MHYTNKDKVSLSVAVWLAEDNYDYNPNPKHMSATTIIKPAKQIVLATRVPQQHIEIDITDQVPSSMGTAFHESIENAWLNGYKKSLYKLGYPKSLVERIYLNPTPEDIAIHEAWDEVQMSAGPPIYVYMEQRVTKAIPGTGYTMGGKYDFVGDGTLEDFKSTGTYGYIKGNKDADYILQGSIYKWLNPDIITSDHMVIQFLFTDWSKLKSMIDAKKGYPPSRILAHRLPLMSVAETEDYLINKTEQIKMLLDMPEKSMPECTLEELWQDPSEFKYFKNPAGKRATRNYDSYAEADEHRLRDGSVGIVKEVKGMAKKCKYCGGAPVCEQRAQLVIDGAFDEDA